MSTCEQLISSLVTDNRRVSDVAFTELEERDLAADDLDVEEVVALYLDPCYSKLNKSICANGGNDGEMVKRAREELFRLATKMTLDDDRAARPRCYHATQVQQRDTRKRPRSSSVEQSRVRRKLRRELRAGFSLRSTLKTERKTD